MPFESLYLQDRLDTLQVDESADLELIERLMDDGRRPEAQPELAGSRLPVLDFDGVMTDNRVVVSQHGTTSVLCSRGDGWGLKRLREAAAGAVLLSAETNPVVADAAAFVRPFVRLATRLPGGEGAVREVTGRILAGKERRKQSA